MCAKMSMIHHFMTHELGDVIFFVLPASAAGLPQQEQSCLRSVADAAGILLLSSRRFCVSCVLLHAPVC